MFGEAEAGDEDFPVVGAEARTGTIDPPRRAGQLADDVLHAHRRIARTLLDDRDVVARGEMRVGERIGDAVDRRDRRPGGLEPRQQVIEVDPADGLL